MATIPPLVRSPGRTLGPSRWRLTAEFVLLFAGVPLAVTFGHTGARHFVLPVLWVGAAGCTWALLRDPAFDRRRFLRIGGWRAAAPGIAVRFALAVVALAGLLLALRPGYFLYLPRHRPLLWGAIVVLYPLLSVVPQGLAYRAFLFHRYRTLAPGPALFAIAVAAFSFAHLPFRNWWAVGLTVPGGILFNLTYRRTESVLISCIEHSAYGCLLFTLGYGEFFYQGSMQVARAVAGP